MLPKDGKLYKYDRMAINVIADNVKGGLSFCDVAVSDDLEAFNANYLHLTETISKTCQDLLDEEAVIVGTSAVTGTELDSIINQYSGIFTNPFVAWGRYRKSTTHRWTVNMPPDSWKNCKRRLIVLDYE